MADFIAQFMKNLASKCNYVLSKLVGPCPTPLAKLTTENLHFGKSNTNRPNVAWALTCPPILGFDRLDPAGTVLP